MTSDLKQIKSPIQEELKEFNEFFNSIFKSNIPLLDRILKYVVKTKGKQLRPLFVILSAAMFGKVNHKTYRSAAMIELLHSATLVHDDVVDDSLKRRGLFSINALWKNKIAVLIGDFLLSRGLLLAVEYKDYDTLEVTSKAVKLMSEGELLQIEKARSLDIKEEVYFDIIRMKTASLIASSCGVGATSVNLSEEKVENVRLLGEKIGIAFQIKDDLLDFSDNNIGKPKGGDIKEKKLTLPLIYALNSANSKEKKRIINSISKSKNHKKTYVEAVKFIEKYKGFEYASDQMFRYKNEAIEMLNTFPISIYRTSFASLIDYVIDRKK